MYKLLGNKYFTHTVTGLAGTAAGFFTNYTLVKHGYMTIDNEKYPPNTDLQQLKKAEAGNTRMTNDKPSGSAVQSVTDAKVGNVDMNMRR